MGVTLTISCICLTCGVRNNHTHPSGLCQNGHDDWLEMWDVVKRNEHFERALDLTGLTADQFTDQFRDITVKQIQING